LGHRPVAFGVSLGRDIVFVCVGLVECALAYLTPALLSVRGDVAADALPVRCIVCVLRCGCHPPPPCGQADPVSVLKPLLRSSRAKIAA